MSEPHRATETGTAAGVPEEVESVETAPAPRRRRPMLLRALEAWGGPRASLRAELADGPTEGRLLAFLLLSLLLAWLADLPRMMQEAARLGLAGGEIAGMAFVSYMLLSPLLIYALAGMVTLSARLLGGKGSHFAHRAAIFWGALCTFPLYFVESTVETMLGGVIGQIAGILSSVAAIVIIGAMVAEANGFDGKRAWRGWAAAVAPVAGLLALAAGLSMLAQGAAG